MVEDKRHTVCLSSQAGCALDCDFCATASMGLIRNLITGEIIDQAIAIRRLVKEPITNVVFMGMGEPFLNYKNVLCASDVFANPKGFNLSTKKITISTAGILPKIKKYISEKHKYKLAISLNAPNDHLRNIIMPINKKWNIKKILNEIKNYDFNTHRLIMFEDVLLKEYYKNKSYR